MELLAAVNQATGYHYANIKHIENTLGVHTWPRTITAEQWWGYYDTLVARVSEPAEEDRQSDHAAPAAPETEDGASQPEAAQPADDETGVDDLPF